ncbi:MAG: 4-phosphoerythronate dehydrogenase [Gammaproteobacteria bacterium]|nr:4-phosphoerythronate dehydrogenase [Gammaproteobacteria bacterium]
MKIVADENIPNVKHYFGFADELILKKGRKINAADLVDADMLLVRSVTKVNQELLEESAVRFVGSATSGIDHLDTKWLDQAGIVWAYAKGCNATAVVEYVICVIAALQKMDILPIKKLRAGVVGAGEIGAQVVTQLEQLNFSVIQHDPIRAMNEKDFLSTPLEDFKDLDLISFHTPLILDGLFPTYHMIKSKFLLQQKKNCILINTSRGEVIDTSDLLEYGQSLYLCLDVWESEPTINLQLLETALIATPHIAGYSVQSKLRGIEMIYKAACELNIIPTTEMSAIEFPKQKNLFLPEKADWQDTVLSVFDPRITSDHMKKILLGDSKITFDDLRKEFYQRNEFSYIL